MIFVARRHRHSYADYLALEEASNVKHEFLDGEIYAMAGGTPEHAALGAAIASALITTLRGGPCRVFSSDLRVRVPATGLATYPDVTVVCGPIERDAESALTVVNPTLIVEVLSDGTEEYDRGEKLEHYQKLPSLGELLLVSQHDKKIERWRRDGSGWARDEVRDGVLSLASVGATLDVDDLYAVALGRV